MGEEYGNKGLELGLKVLDFLFLEALEWKTLEEISQGAGVSKSQAYNALHTLVKREWAEKSERGFRAAAGAVRYAMQVQEALLVTGRRLGVRE